jgi:putative ABC transport system ATP-binding protein
MVRNTQAFIRENRMPIVLSAEGAAFKNIIHYPNLAIETGQAVFIRGESGCGKSTLLRMFNATLSPDEGIIRYTGTDITGIDAIALRREVLLAGQPVYLFDSSIADNFNEFYAYRGMPAPDAETMRAFLSLCRADFPVETDCKKLSTGERQRVYLAIYTSFKPQVLMLDEPTSALDAQNAAALMESLCEFCKAKGLTLVVVTHDAALAGRYADRVIELKGRVCNG